MSLYYDIDGKPLASVAEWGDTRRKHRHVAKTTLADGKWVSTVYIGIDHGCGDGPPLIFETMVFESADDLADLEVRRYSTLDEARNGHESMVLKWSAKP